MNNLTLPPGSIIEGNITQLDESGFILTDAFGSIDDRDKLSDNKKQLFLFANKSEPIAACRADRKNI
jgi:hypothetical protein